jgi:hypothetical protein
VLAIAAEHPEVAPVLATLSDADRRLLDEPERHYTGLAAQKVDQVCDRWEQMLAVAVGAMPTAAR